MHISPNHMSIGRIFEQNILFQVPKYQRYYAWDDEQVEDFIKDIDTILKKAEEETKGEHFFGGIVCAKIDVEGSTRQQKELIDGQQRITTAILLVINIIRFYNELLSDKEILQEDAKIIEKRIEKITDKYLIYNDEINRRPLVVNKLVLSVADDEYFKSLLGNSPIKEERDSHKRLSRALNKIKVYIQHKLSGCSSISEKIDVLALLEGVLYNCTVIFMDCDSRESAYKLFQALNDRGAGLTEGDLLKSKTLEVLEKHPQMQSQVNALWDDILKDEPRSVENFLRTYYASVMGKRAGRTSLYDDYIENIFHDIRDVTEDISEDVAKSVCDTVKTLHNEIVVYRKVVSGEWPFESAQPITDWDRNRLRVLVKFLSYDITMPLLLAAVKLGEKKFSLLVHKLELFMFRYKTICGNSHQILSTIFTIEAREIREDATRYSINNLLNQLKELLSEKANDETFSIQLENLKYNTSGNNKILRYFFSTLCDYERWYSTGTTQKPTAYKENIINYDTVTIEHIYSQNPKEEVSTESFAELISNEHKLFNLTILSQDDNSERVKNKPFNEKRPIYEASNYAINKVLSEYTCWGDENARSWKEYLLKFACKVFVV